MAVYVDSERHPYGRMLMSHMMADTEAELHAMADLIGVSRNWIQRSRSGMVHYDICQKKRVLALSAGAQVIDRRGVVELMKRMTRSVVTTGTRPRK